MALTPTEEAQVRQLLAQQTELLTLAGSETTIMSKLGATKVTLSDLTAATSISGSDLFLVRQGSSDKKATGSVISDFVSSSFVTPPQFDNDTSPATTAFVQRALGNYSARSTITSNQTLTASNAGNVVNINGSSITVTLPLSTAVPAGTVICFENDGPDATISRQGSDVIVTGSSSINSLIIKTGDTLLVESNNLGGWRIISGSTQSTYSPLFGASLAVNGFQKLPSGRIEVQGTFTASATPGNAVAVVFPQSATNVRNLVLTPVSTGTSAISAWFDTPTGSGFNGHCSVASAVVHYRAILD